MGLTASACGATRPLRVRAHHLLCALGFRGLGYSEAFVARMREVVHRLRSRPDDEIVVTDSEDVICEVCPHNSPEGCIRGQGKAEAVRKRDLALLRVPGMGAGAEIVVGNAYRRIRETVTPEILKNELCKGCAWEELGYCAQGLRELRAE